MMLMLPRGGIFAAVEAYHDRPERLVHAVDRGDARRLNPKTGKP
jgi:hypothetical protein